MAKIIKVELTEEQIKHLRVLLEMAIGTPEFFAPSSERQMLYDLNRIYKKLFGHDYAGY